MPIETDFRFSQFRDAAKIQAFGLTTKDLLGPLRSFIGAHHVRSWEGSGFNLIWRPHDKSGSNTQDFFLELDMTKDAISFTDITGATGIANRGLLQGDVVLGGLAYQQEVTDVLKTPAKPLHFEPGVWISIPNTTNPKEDATVTRMGSIPHGTTVNAQGKAFDSPSGKPLFTPVSIMPFKIGSPDDGVTGIVPFPEGKTPLATVMTARTPLSDVAGLTDAHFQDPSRILADVAGRQTIRSTKVFQITTNVAAKTSSQSPNPGVPHEGGGVRNIAFLVGASGGPNADAAQMTATFWVEEVSGPDGKTFLQLQYVQRVLLNFNGLSWPHVSVGTMTVVSEK